MELLYTCREKPFHNGNRFSQHARKIAPNIADQLPFHKQLMTKQLVTVQVGTYSNYLGAHFWNLQDEYLATPAHLRELSPNVLFREVRPSSRAYASGLRYAPRVQVIDSGGAFGALSHDAGVVLSKHISKSNLPVSSWHGKEQQFMHDPIAPSSYIQQLQEEEAEQLDHLPPSGNPSVAPVRDTGLEHRVNYWSDFLKVRLHSRTCFKIPAVHHQVSNIKHFQTGTDLATSSLLDDMYDDLRFFIEESDSFGGINVLSNADDAFSGLTASYMSYIMEELGSSTPMLIFGLHNVDRTYSSKAASCFQMPYKRTDEATFARNEAQFVSDCFNISAEYIPLSSQSVRSISLLCPDKANMFHSSAALSLSLDVALSPVRQHGTSLVDLLDSIQPVSYLTLGSIACNLPHINEKVVYGPNIFQTPGTTNLSNAWSPKVSGAFSCTTGESVVPLKCKENVTARGLTYPLPCSTALSLPIVIPIPFPPIFGPSFTKGPSNQTACPQQGGVVVDEVSMLAGLGTVAEDGYHCLMSLKQSLESNLFPRTEEFEEGTLQEEKESLQSRAEDYFTF